MTDSALEALLTALALPPAARVTQRVAKALLSERGALSTTDRRLVETGLERLTWRATLTPSSAALAAWRDDARDYSQIVVMEARTRPEAKLDRLLEVIHRAVAHPLVLIAGDDAGAALSVGLKRRHEREADRVVVERLATSPVVSVPLLPVDEALLTSLDLAAVGAHDLWSLHTRWGERVEAHAAARITGLFRLATDPGQIEARREALADHAAQAREVTRLRKAARTERQLNRRIELSREVTRAEGRLADMTTRLA